MNDLTCVTNLTFGASTVWSTEGVQQGDHLGPLLFCLTIQPLLRSLSSNLVAGYIDDVTVGGSTARVVDDVTKISTIGPSYGLQLNASKCETISKSGAVSHTVLRDFEQITEDSAMLLGTPLSTGSALTCLALRYCDVLT